MNPINVALIGYAFMGRAHSNAYRQVGPFFSPKRPPPDEGDLWSVGPRR